MSNSLLAGIPLDDVHSQILKRLGKTGVHTLTYVAVPNAGSDYRILQTN